jgi:putative flippase GtrA
VPTPAPAEEAPFERLKTLIRSCAAGLAATGADMVTLTLLVGVAHWQPRSANVPALVVGGVVNFVGNRHYAFHAREGNAAKQALGFSVVEVIALGLNGLLYDLVLRLVPAATGVYWLVRLATTNAVFLLWSYPLWRRVFRVRSPAPS